MERTEFGFTLLRKRTKQATATFFAVTSEKWPSGLIQRKATGADENAAIDLSAELLNVTLTIAQ